MATLLTKVEKCWDSHVRPTMKSVHETLEMSLLFKGQEAEEVKKDYLVTRRQSFAAGVCNTNPDLTSATHAPSIPLTAALGDAAAVKGINGHPALHRSQSSSLLNSAFNDSMVVLSPSKHRDDHHHNGNGKHDKKNQKKAKRRNSFLRERRYFDSSSSDDSVDDFAMDDNDKYDNKQSCVRCSSGGSGSCRLITRL